MSRSPDANSSRWASTVRSTLAHRCLSTPSWSSRRGMTRRSWSANNSTPATGIRAITRYRLGAQVGRRVPLVGVRLRRSHDSGIRRRTPLDRRGARTSWARRPAAALACISATRDSTIAWSQWPLCVMRSSRRLQPAAPDGAGLWRRCRTPPSSTIAGVRPATGRRSARCRSRRRRPGSDHAERYQASAPNPVQSGRARADPHPEAPSGRAPAPLRIPLGGCGAPRREEARSR